jgi:uncharacterized membrane protein
MSEQTTERERPGKLERLLGDRPGALIVRLVLISLVVGFLMAMFGLNPQSLINTAIELVRDALRDSTGLLRSIAFYVVTGAVIVVPVWLVLRLASRRR